MAEPIDISSSEHDIAMRLATGFAGICVEFLPTCAEAVQRSDKKVSFGARVELWREKGVIVGRLVPSAPKIPVDDLDEVNFCLQLEQTGQLSFLFAGELKELIEAKAALEAKASEDDDLDPAGDNAETASG